MADQIVRLAGLETPGNTRTVSLRIFGAGGEGRGGWRTDDLGVSNTVTFENRGNGQPARTLNIVVPAGLFDTGAETITIAPGASAVRTVATGAASQTFTYSVWFTSTIDTGSGDIKTDRYTWDPRFIIGP